MATFPKTRAALSGVSRGRGTHQMVIDAEAELEAHRSKTRGVPAAMKRLRRIMDMPDREGHTDAYVINETVRHLEMFSRGDHS